MGNMPPGALTLEIAQPVGPGAVTALIYLGIRVPVWKTLINDTAHALGADYAQTQCLVLCWARGLS